MEIGANNSLSGVGEKSIDTDKSTKTKHFSLVLLRASLTAPTIRSFWKKKYLFFMVPWDPRVPRGSHGSIFGFLSTWGYWKSPLSTNGHVWTVPAEQKLLGAHFLVVMPRDPRVPRRFTTHYSIQTQKERAKSYWAVALSKQRS